MQICQATPPHPAQVVSGLVVVLPSLKRRKLKSKAKLESSSSYFSFKALSSRRFQLGFDRVDLHRPTSPFRQQVLVLHGPLHNVPHDGHAQDQGLTLVHFSA